MAHGLPKLPRVNPGTLLASSKTRSVVDAASRRTYQRMKAGELWHVESKHDLDVRKTLRRNWLLAAPLASVFVLDWRDEGSLSAQLLAPDAAVDALRGTAKSFGPFDRKLAARSDSALLDMVRKVPVYRVSGRADPSMLAREIARGRIGEVVAAPGPRRGPPGPTARTGSRPRARSR
jgi:HprK-related kinase B